MTALRKPAELRQRPHLVMVGNGMAAVRTIENVLQRAPDEYRITVFGAEPCGHYNRIMLSAVLAGSATVDGIITHPPSWYAGHGIALHTGDPVVAIDLESRSVRSAGGRVETWDRLVLATGAAPILPSIPGIGLKGVCAFRDVRDVTRMVRATETHRRAVVIGGGVLGLEAAWGLKRRGMAVAVVHLNPTLMERQLDETAGGLLRRDLDGRGIACITGAQAVGLVGEERVSGVLLSDGRELAADLVVVAIGIQPETKLAGDAGLAVGRGIRVGDTMRTSHPDVLAVGECVEHDGRCFGLVAPLWDMARVCAEQLTRAPDPRGFTPLPVSTNLKIPGIDIFSAGCVTAANDHDQEIIHHDASRGVYRKLVLRDGRVVGTVLYRDLGGSDRFLQWMRDGTDVDAAHGGGHDRRGLLDIGDDATGPLDIDDGMLVCHCHGVTKGAIAAAIRDDRLENLDQVCARTRAGTGCGQCRVLTARILAREVGGGEAAVAAVARRTARMRTGFRVWHHTNAALMTILLLSGLSLHYPASPVALMDFAWAFRLHSWSGLALCAAYAGFLALCLGFRRWFRADVQGVAMYVGMPLVVASGLIFLWPSMVPDRFAGVGALAPVAIAHTAVAVTILMFVVHHLSHAPWAWWKKRRLRHSVGAATSPFPSPSTKELKNAIE